MSLTPRLAGMGNDFPGIPDGPGQATPGLSISLFFFRCFHNEENIFKGGQGGKSARFWNRSPIFRRGGARICLVRIQQDTSGHAISPNGRFQTGKTPQGDTLPDRWDEKHSDLPAKP